jgi:hypothetical protein
MFFSRYLTEFWDLWRKILPLWNYPEVGVGVFFPFCEKPEAYPRSFQGRTVNLQSYSEWASAPFGKRSVKP